MDNIPLKKNEEYIVDIIDNGYEGEGIAKINNFTIFIPGTIKGEKIKILIVKVNSSYAFGKILEILEKSNTRTESDCSTYKRCGGCNLRHIRYEDTLILKKDIVQNLVDKTLNTQIKVKETIGMDNPYYYRNKAQYPIGYDKDGKITTGVYAARSHEIIPINQCQIQQPISQKIAKWIINFMQENGITAYNEQTTKGVIRHVVIKVGIHTNEVMCILVTNEKNIPKEAQLVKGLIKNFNNITTIVKNINTKNTNVILGKENIVLYGNGYITDMLGEYTFKISPLSFYQINPIQTEKLYNLAIQSANLNKNESILDLYCGIGTIGIFASKKVKQVYGIEIIPQAIKDAEENAKINNIKNIKFFCGDVEKVLDEIVKKEKVKPNVIFVDPPRKGLDNNTVQNILNYAPEKIIYISCNPATLVRDLKVFEQKYDIKEIQPVDMFPFTSNVECVAVLQLGIKRMDVELANNIKKYLGDME